MLAPSLRNSRALATVLPLALVSLAVADNPRQEIPAKGTNSAQTQRQAERAAQQAKQDAIDELEAKMAEAKRRAAKAEAESAEAEAKLQASWNALNPKLRELLDPEITAAQYELIETYLKAHPSDFQSSVEMAFQDDVVRIIEFMGIQSTWDRVVAREAKVRTKALIEELRNAQK